MNKKAQKRQNKKDSKNIRRKGVKGKMKVKKEIARRIKSEKEKINLQRTSKEQERGITLVALVITIVILIILATVSINVVLGEGGLIQRAQQAKELTEQAALGEQQELNILMSKYANIMAENQTPIEPPEESEKEKAVLKYVGDIPDGEYIDIYEYPYFNIEIEVVKGDGILKYEMLEGEDIASVSQSGEVELWGIGYFSIKVSMDSTSNFEAADPLILNFNGITIQP